MNNEKKNFKPADIVYMNIYLSICAQRCIMTSHVLCSMLLTPTLTFCVAEINGSEHECFVLKLSTR